MNNFPAHPIIRLFRLSPARRRLLILASFVLTSASAAVALLTFRRAMRFGLVPLGASHNSAADVVWAIEAASRRLPWRTVCIEKGLAAQRMLRRCGLPAILHYGARDGADAQLLQAHVWVTIHDRIWIGGEEAPHYAELASYP